MSDAVNIAIAGATGAVGTELLELLAEREFPVGELRLMASPRSAGRTVQVLGRSIVIEDLEQADFAGVDIALFSAGGSRSLAHAPRAAEAGAVVIDNSSAYRMDPSCPLVVPEVNPQAMASFQLGQGGIIANPNCSTIIMLMAVTPLHREAQVNRIVVSTYQAASGAGAAAMAELEQQTREVLDGNAPTCEQFPVQYAFNLFSHNSDIGPDGYNTEETKMVRETHKIWDQPEDSRTAITATCVRVPIMRAHAESINLSFVDPISESRARRLLESAAGVTVLDDREANRFPMPLDATGRDNVYVGRIREDPSQSPGHGLDLFVCGDQIRKGAALNAIQIAELLVGVPVAN